MSKSFKRLLIVFLFVFLFGLKAVSIADLVAEGKTIVCFGASLTAGEGAEPGDDYPSQLRKMVNLPVINAGVQGDSSVDELKRLQEDVLEKNPEIVIITQRTNDLKHYIPKQDSLNNLEMIIDRIQHYGARVFLVTFETQEFKESYFKDIRNLAMKKHVIVIADVLNGIDSNPQYMHDSIHPNNAGYGVVAKRVYQAIEPYLK